MGDGDATKHAIGSMIDNAYKQWSDATREFYGASAMAAFAPRASKAGEGAKVPARSA
jgi:hypothetical protein